MSTYDVLQLHPEVSVGWSADLPEGVWGRTYPQLRTILLRRGLTQAQRRVTFRHEWAHLIHGDTGEERGRDRRRDDARADQAAAHMLIELDQLADALRWSRDAHEVADELAVTPECLQVRLAHLHPAERAHLRAALNEGEMP